MSYDEGLSVVSGTTNRPVKKAELFTNERSPLCSLWRLFCTGAERVKVIDRGGWVYVFAATDQLDARDNMVVGLDMTQRPRTMYIKPGLVAIRQVFVSATGSGSAASFCFDIGVWRTWSLGPNSVVGL